MCVHGAVEMSSCSELGGLKSAVTMRPCSCLTSSECVLGWAVGSAATVASCLQRSYCILNSSAARPNQVVRTNETHTIPQKRRKRLVLRDSCVSRSRVAGISCDGVMRTKLIDRNENIFRTKTTRTMLAHIASHH